MIKEEQLAFCRKCINRKMDLKQGLICNLTNEKAAFYGECADFKIDETVKEAPLDDKEGLPTREIKEKLSPETIEKLRMEQKLIPAILAGLVVGILGSILWGVITVATGYQIGYMAIAVGAGVGFVIRKTGNGIDNVFGIWGAGISLLSVLLGNFLSIIGFIANAEGLGYIETLLRFDFSYLPTIMAETFSAMDLLFYGFAVFEGYKFSFRVITEKSLQEMKVMS